MKKYNLVMSVIFLISVGFPLARGFADEDSSSYENIDEIEYELIVSLDEVTGDGTEDNGSDIDIESDTACSEGDDGDGDGLCNSQDPCPNDWQNDVDGDGICGDVDPCPDLAEHDIDSDGILDCEDDCLDMTSTIVPGIADCDIGERETGDSCEIEDSPAESFDGTGYENRSDIGITQVIVPQGGANNAALPDGCFINPAPPTTYGECMNQCERVSTCCEARRTVACTILFRSCVLAIFYLPCDKVYEKTCTGQWNTCAVKCATLY